MLMRKTFGQEAHPFWLKTPFSVGNIPFPEEKTLFIRDTPCLILAGKSFGGEGSGNWEGSFPTQK